MWIHFPPFKILMYSEIPLDNHLKPILRLFSPLLTPLKAFFYRIFFWFKSNLILLTHQILIRTICYLIVGPP